MAHLGHITIKTKKSPPNLSVHVLMGEEGCVITGGYADWEVVSRPRRTSITQYRGRTPYEMTAAIIFDGFREGEEIEQEISHLERMALPYDKEPPPVLVLGSAVPHGGNDMDWIITNIEWGDKIRNNRGRRVRQAATVTFMGYNAADRVQLRAAKKARAKAGRP